MNFVQAAIGMQQHGDRIKPSPDYSGTDVTVTDEERRMMERHTFYKRDVTEEHGEQFQVWFAAGVQSFPVGSPCETTEHADWYCWMLAKALLKVKLE